MKRLIAALSLLVLTTCVYMIPDYKWRSKGKFKQTSSIFVRIGGADQICASKVGTIDVFIFVTLIGLPAQPVRIIVNDSAADMVLYGTDVTLYLAKVGLGTHSIKVYAGEQYAYKTFSVWSCGGQ